MAGMSQARWDIMVKGKIISITRVKITSDLMDARVYISAFPMDDQKTFMEYVEAESPRIKNILAQRIKHQMRRIPNIQYVFDDSLDYVDEIDKALKGKGEDPIHDSKI